MQKVEMSGMAAVTTNLGTFGLFSLSIVAISSVISLIISFPLSIMIVSVLFGTGIVFMMRSGQRRQISVTSCVMLASFAAIGVSIENEKVFGRAAEPIAFLSVVVLLISVPVLVYIIFSPLWANSYK